MGDKSFSILQEGEPHTEDVGLPCKIVFGKRENPFFSKSSHHSIKGASPSDQYILFFIFFRSNFSKNSKNSLLKTKTFD